MATALVPSLPELPNLPPIQNAKLPAVYSRAREALAKCERLDECQQWADRAAALASYARQIKDRSLVNMALRIHARAYERAANLMKQVPKSKGGRPKTGKAALTSSRKAAADGAGLTKHQRRVVQRIGNIPKDEFDQRVESDDPPTITELAESGTDHRLVDLEGRSPDDYALSTQVQGRVESFAAYISKTDLTAAVRGAKLHERREMLQHADQAVTFLNSLIAILQKETP